MLAWSWGSSRAQSQLSKCRLSHPESLPILDQSPSLGLWRKECSPGALSSPVVHRERQIQDLGRWRRIRNTAEEGSPLWEAPPGQSPQRTTLTEEVGVILVKGVVTPEVSPQAVDQLPVTGTEPHWTEGVVFCKKHAKYR